MRGDRTGVSRSTSADSNSRMARPNRSRSEVLGTRAAAIEKSPLRPFLTAREGRDQPTKLTPRAPLCAVLPGEIGTPPKGSPFWSIAN
jgi:hypothetical protein